MPRQYHPSKVDNNVELVMMEKSFRSVLSSPNIVTIAEISAGDTLYPAKLPDVAIRVDFIEDLYDKCVWGSFR